MAAKDDSVETRIPASCPAPISQILRTAWHHDLAGLKPLLKEPESARVQEPTTGESPLHAAIRACAPANQGALADDDVEERAKAVVHELFMSGAIWNSLDNNDETPGCVAARLGLQGLYTLCVEAGVRAELLFGLLDGYEELESDDGEEEEEGGDAQDEGEVNEGEDANGNAETDGAAEDVEAVVDSEQTFVPKRAGGPDVNSKDYLRSDLTYSDGKLVDSAQNGVMSKYTETNLPFETAGRGLEHLEATH